MSQPVLSNWDNRKSNSYGYVAYATSATSAIASIAAQGSSRKTTESFRMSLGRMGKKGLGNLKSIIWNKPLVQTTQQEHSDLHASYLEATFV